MVLTNFNGAGVGFGFGIGCGFGIGWGFGGAPLNILGLGAGGGCGIGLGLGWGFGSAFGGQYRSSRVTFEGVEFTSKDQREVKGSKVASQSTRVAPFGSCFFPKLLNGHFGNRREILFHSSTCLLYLKSEMKKLGI